VFYSVKLYLFVELGEVMSRRAVSAVIIAMLLAGILTVAFNVELVKSDYAWTEPIYIRADGSISPATAPISSVDNVTYTLTDNIEGNVPADSSAIIIQRDNIIIDGAGHTITGTEATNSTGIELTERNNVTIKNMKITIFWDGIWLDHSLSNNSVSGNNITANNYYGIYLESSSNNSVSGNDITNNGEGIYLNSSSNNTIYTNNFVNNTSQVYSLGSTNVWNDGYPSGGNYWSGYNGTDLYSGPYQNQTGSDGIGDTPYLIDANNTDYFPLMGMFSSFSTLQGYPVNVISNFTISGFVAPIWLEHPEIVTLTFNMTGTEGSTGFCRVTIPNVIIQNVWQGNYTVLVDGEPWPTTNWTDAANTYIYFNYIHSQHQTVIIPELSSPLILPILMIMTLLAMIASRKRWSKHHHEES
jgi:parallel beta-helix repeat protein